MNDARMSGLMASDGSVEIAHHVPVRIVRDLVHFEHYSAEFVAVSLVDVGVEEFLEGHRPAAVGQPDACGVTVAKFASSFRPAGLGPRHAPILPERSAGGIGSPPGDRPARGPAAVDPRRHFTIPVTGLDPGRIIDRLMADGPDSSGIVQDRPVGRQ